MLLAFINRIYKAVRRRYVNALWRKQDYILSRLPVLSYDMYERNKSIEELEHQSGRYLNMLMIANEMRGIEGDIIEFGTWQGLGLILLSHAFADDTTTRNLIGIDSFEGLPESSTIWTRGDFNNTSLEVAKHNIQQRKHQNPALSFQLIKGWFSDKNVAIELQKATHNIALVHFDADLGTSTTQALKLVEPYLIGRTTPIYFLFDDWGCQPDEVPDAFYAWLATKPGMLAQKLSSTRYTRYYKLVF